MINDTLSGVHDHIERDFSSRQWSLPFFTITCCMSR